MNTKGAADVVAVVWLLVFTYLVAVSFIFGSIEELSEFAFAIPLGLVPALIWIGWRSYRREGFFFEPTAKQTIFLGGLLGLFAIAQYFDIVHALTTPQL